MKGKVTSIKVSQEGSRSVDTDPGKGASNLRGGVGGLHGATAGEQLLVAEKQGKPEKGGEPKGLPESGRGKLALLENCC